MSASARCRSPAVLAAIAAAALACKPSALSDGIARPYDCNSCHGTAANSEAARGAPPKGLHGVTATTEVGVGAHQLHLRDTPIRNAIACSECHVVPANVEDAGHVDQPHATVTWGPLATAKGVVPTWNHDAATCSSVYCHGATLRGGVEPSPRWTYAAEPTFAGPPTETCATCHGWPPPPPHTSITTCWSCHPATVLADGTIDRAGGYHVNGHVEVAGQCSACHGNTVNAAPPKALDGATSTTNVEVGAHQLHLRDTPIRSALDCSECHVVPQAVDAPGHIDQPHATVTWGSLAAAKGAAPSWNRDAGTCAKVYCHGATLHGGVEPSPSWTYAAEPTFAGPQTEICTPCHGWPPPPPHTAITTCWSCHPMTVLTDGTIDRAGGHHIDGRLDIAGECTDCHGSTINAAPPKAVDASASTTNVAVGAHQLHLRNTPIRKAIDCSECHVVPATRDAPGHIDQLTATVTWGSLATAKGAAPTWDHAAATCSAVYCHGATLEGGVEPSPSWTYAAEPSFTGPQPEICTPCHGWPPPPPHTALTNCGTCHPDTVREDGTIDVAGGHHIDGKLDFAGDCSTCHGSALNPAPPNAVDGSSSTTVVAVGAHQLHLHDTPIRRAVECSECHVVPGNVDDPGHIDQPHATLTWGPLATAKNAGPSWNHDDATCSTVYCHGATLDHESQPVGPQWTFAQEPTFSGPPTDCTKCHDWPYASPHPQMTNCSECHPATVFPDGTIDVAGGRHINGVRDLANMPCGTCHGIPPATLSHLVHYSDITIPPQTYYGDLRVLEDHLPGTAPGYLFGCGNCHPSTLLADGTIDESKHMNHHVDVELYDASAPPRTLKARNPPEATYTGQLQRPRSKGSCASVYCHSTGQEAPGVYATTPTWDSATSLGCNGCHDNPPRYESGGPGTSTANTHLVIADDGWELGHFGGLPGPWHGSKHGVNWWGYSDDASPITCQTCHYDTVDPSNTGPSGFYYLDTTGNYDLGGPLQYRCSDCHTGESGAPPIGPGKVLALRHVNGKREVVFDPRMTLPPGIAWLPAPYTPTRPIWVTNAEPGPFVPADATWDGPDGTTLSAHLGSAAYEPSTKTCTKVACHLGQTTVIWGAPGGWVACGSCHPWN